MLVYVPGSRLCARYERSLFLSRVHLVQIQSFPSLLLAKVEKKKNSLQYNLSITRGNMDLYISHVT